MKRIDMKEKLMGAPIVDAKIWGNGLVVLTRTLEVVAALDFDRTVYSRLQIPGTTLPFSTFLTMTGFQNMPTSWAIIEPQLSPTGTLQVFFCTAAGTIICVSEKDRVDVGLKGGPYSQISVSPTGKVIALYTPQGFIQILTSDFTTELTRFGTRAHSSPETMAWCGGDAVVAVWGTEIDYVALLVTPDGTYGSVRYEDAVVLATECDGIRVLGAAGCEYISRISSKSLPKTPLTDHSLGSQTFIYSTTPNAASQLFRASDYFYAKHSPRCDDLIRAIKAGGELEPAIRVLIDAAGHEWDPKRQTELLTGAAFGKVLPVLVDFQLTFFTELS